jgi:cytochrome c biogenesis protein CcdA
VPAAACPWRAGAGASEKTDTSLPVLLLFAILGGLILNLMPCVFPVLSIKAIGLVEQAKKHPAAVRTKGLVFAAGVISSMLCLAAVLLVLRAGGEQIGWGFQLQSPLFVTLLVYLLLAVGLNLSGVFEMGGGLAGVGDGLTQGDGYRASFFTGVLTTLVATPCTAPFMAFAVGAALTQPPVVALLIFAPWAGSRAALPAPVLRALDAPRTAETGRVDGYAEAVLCLPDLCLGGVAAVGAGTADIIVGTGCRAGRRHPGRTWRRGPTKSPSRARAGAARPHW